MAEFFDAKIHAKIHFLYTCYHIKVYNIINPWKVGATIGRGLKGDFKILAIFLAILAEYSTHLAEYSTHLAEYSTHLAEFLTHLAEFLTHLAEFSIFGRIFNIWQNFQYLAELLLFGRTYYIW